MLPQDRKPSVNELDVNPIHEQGSLTQLDERAESPLSQPPATPGIGSKQNREENADANQEKRRTGMPEIVNGIPVERKRIGPSRGLYQHYSEYTDEQDGHCCPFLGPVTQQYEARRQAEKGESCPRENREKPGLWLAQIVHAIHI